MKRGPKVGVPPYVARHSKCVIPREFHELASRRTLPFLDRAGLDRPVSFLLQEAYLQGIRDAVAAISKQEGA